MTQTAAQEATGKFFSVHCLKNWLGRRGNQLCEKVNWNLFLSSLKMTQSTENDGASKTERLNLRD